MKIKQVKERRRKKGVNEMDEKQFKELSGKLDLITRLLALNLVKDMKTQIEKISTLSNFGFSPIDIANSLGTSPNTVSVTLSRIRREKKQTPIKEIEFHVEDLHTVLSNSTMFPSIRELGDFADKILQPQPQLSYYNQKEEMINEIIKAFQKSDRIKQALFIQALEHRAEARELRDTQFLKFLEAWESHIRGSTSV